MAQKDFLKDMEMEGPAGAAPMDAPEEDFADMEMPEEEEEAAPEFTSDDVKKLYDDNPDFAAEINPIASQYMETAPEGEEENAEEAAEDYPEEEEAEEELF